jgi:hypothetical protein
VNNRTSFLIGCVGLLAVGWVEVSSVQAYVLYSTDPNTAPPGCEAPQPQKLYWTTDEIVYHVETPSHLEDGQPAVDAIHLSFTAWTESLDCSQPNFVYGGLQEDPTQGGTMPRVGFDEGFAEKNQNLLLWVQSVSEWRHGPGVLGLTTVTFNTCTGEVVDSDIEINVAEFGFSATEVPPEGSIDIQNTVTHEVGHLLGLDHSMDSEATMHSSSPDAETKKRDLTSDDEEGLCCIYCPNTQFHIPELVCTSGVAECMGLPLEEEGGGEEEGAGGCSTSGSKSGLVFMLLCVLLAIQIRPQRRPLFPVR